MGDAGPWESNRMSQHCYDSISDVARVMALMFCVLFADVISTHLPLWQAEQACTVAAPGWLSQLELGKNLQQRRSTQYART
jgi:hypothetical protein